MKLHLNKKWIYTADTDLSPSGMAKFDVEDGTAEYLYDNPLPGTYPFCGDFWLDPLAGGWLVSRCAYVFQSTDEEISDLTYLAHLDGVEYVKSMDVSAASNQVVVLLDEAPFADQRDNRLIVFDRPDFDYHKEWNLPDYVGEDDKYRFHGKYVFMDNDGKIVYIIAQVDPSAGLSDDKSHRLIHYDLF